jgi:hypothetical protein
MPFSFNFNVGEPSSLNSDKADGVKLTDNAVTVTTANGTNTEVTEAREWFPAEEIFLSERHHAKG